MKSDKEIVQDQIDSMVSFVNSTDDSGQRRIDLAVEAFRKRGDESISQRLVNAMNTLVPDFSNGSDRSPVGNVRLNLSNSVWDPLDRIPYHIVSQVLLKGRAMIYISHSNLHQIEDAYSCNCELLLRLHDLGLIVVVNQQRDIDEWKESLLPANKRILERAVTPGAAVDELLKILFPNFSDQKDRYLAQLNSLPPESKQVLKTTGINDNKAKTIAYRMASLHVAEYADIGWLESQLTTSPDEFSLHLNYAYRSFFGRPFSCFGADFIWPQQERKRFFEPIKGAELKSEESGVNYDNQTIEMIRVAYEPLLGPAPQPVGASAWSALKDHGTAANFGHFLESLRVSDYWKKLPEAYSALRQMEFDLVANRSGDAHQAPMRVREKLTILDQERRLAADGLMISAAFLAPFASPAPFIPSVIGLGLAGYVWDKVQPQVVEAAHSKIARTYPKVLGALQSGIEQVCPGVHFKDRTGWNALTYIDELRDQVEKFRLF